MNTIRGMLYTVRRARRRPELLGLWESDAWRGAETAEIASFRPEGSTHRPHTSFRLLYDNEFLFGLYSVHDRHVRCVVTRVQGPVWKDSCVELFLQPRENHGYFNFEFNCGGTFLCHYHPEGATAPSFPPPVHPLPDTECAQIAIFHSLPPVVDPEISDSVNWCLEFALPFWILERYVGALRPVAGKTWRGNLYKCGDETSHPHWAAWSPVDRLDFHLPRCFGALHFAGE